ncbi:MAG: GDSL-type esterase/lipase family protein [Sphaerobacter sp.]|nr:GDSL-type esterase/lipase family protein [Sphaerobacter sp.]
MSHACRGGRAGAILAVALVGALLTPLTAWLTGPAAAQPAPAEQVYLALGDSIAAGLVTTLPRLRGYPWLVRDLIAQSAVGREAPAVTLINRAVPGETARSFLAGGQVQQARADIAAARARGAQVRAVTISLGGNELLNLAGSGEAERQAGLTQFRSVYPAVLGAVKAALGDTPAEIVVTTSYDLSAGDPSVAGSDAWWVHQFNEVIRQAAAAAGVRVADLEPAFRGHIRDWTWYPTDVHPNNAGHAAIAQLVWQALGYDQTPPSVTVERPAPRALDRRLATVRVRATDDVGVTRVELLAGGEYVGELLYVPSQDAYLGIWDGRDWAEPTARLTVRASDLAGHQTEAQFEVALPGS